MKFRIINKSRYQTRHIRAFVTRAYRLAKAAAGTKRVGEFERVVGRTTITFARSNRRAHGNSTGHAYIGRGRAHVGINDAANKRDFARVVAHEFGHCLGLMHADMSGGPLWGVGMTEEQSVRLYGWADALPLEKIAPKKLPPRADRAYENACIRLKKWESRAKRAATAIKKLRQATARYERLNRGGRVTEKPSVATSVHAEPKEPGSSSLA